MLKTQRDGSEWVMEQHRAEQGWTHIIKIDGVDKFQGIHPKRMSQKDFAAYVDSFVIVDKRTQEEEDEIDRILGMNRRKKVFGIASIVFMVMFVLYLLNWLSGSV